jgi:hypothetical protein
MSVSMVTGTDADRPSEVEGPLHKLLSATRLRSRRAASGRHARNPSLAPSSLPRLYVNPQLSSGAALTLEGPQANYLSAVMRLAPAGQVKLFDDRTGEWLAEDLGSRKKRVTLRIVRHLRPREPVPDCGCSSRRSSAAGSTGSPKRRPSSAVARLVPVITQRRSSTAPTPIACSRT